MAKPKAPPVVETEKTPPVVEPATETPAPTGAPETLAPPVKRGRGRPPRDPNDSASKPGNASPRSHKKSGAKVSYTKDAEQKLAKQIVGLHQIGALMSGIPEMHISEAEGEMLATGVIAVASEYDLELSGKTGAAIQLLMACVAVYVPRLLAVKNRVAQQAALNAQSAHVDNTAVN
jgi:hypothetical protein